MTIELTMGQYYALCKHIGFLIVPADGGFIDTKENEFIVFGPTCPEEYKLPNGVTLKPINVEKDEWKVE